MGGSVGAWINEWSDPLCGRRTDVLNFLGPCCMYCFIPLCLVSTKGLFVRLQNLEYILTEMYRNG